MQNIFRKIQSLTSIKTILSKNFWNAKPKLHVLDCTQKQYIIFSQNMNSDFDQEIAILRAIFFFCGCCCFQQFYFKGELKFGDLGRKKRNEIFIFRSFFPLFANNCPIHNFQLNISILHFIIAALFFKFSSELDIGNLSKIQHQG